MSNSLAISITPHYDACVASLLFNFQPIYYMGLIFSCQLLFILHLNPIDLDVIDIQVLSPLSSKTSFNESCWNLLVFCLNVQTLESELGVKVAAILRQRVALTMENCKLKQEVARLRQKKIMMECKLCLFVDSNGLL